MTSNTAKLLLHPRNGDRLVILRDSADSKGRSFRFEILTRTIVPPPADHVHRDQTERVKVLAGALRARIAGRELVLRAGDALMIPPGTPHAIWNGDSGETRTLGEFRPARDMQQRIEAYFRGDARGVA